MSIEAFIFDIGNVVVRFEPWRAEQALQEYGGIPDRGALSRLAVCYERGTIETGAFLGALRELFLDRIPESVLAGIWQEVFSPNEPMWELIARLKTRYPLYLLSNTNDLHHRHLVERYPVFGNFADGVFSYRAKLMKPEPEIYALAIRQFDVRPESTVYIDDLAANVEGGRAAGLRAIAYDPDAHEAALAVLCELGLQCV